LFRKITELQHRWQQNWILILMTDSTKSDMSFINPTSKAGLQLLNLRLLKVMFNCVHKGVMIIKPRNYTNGNARVI
jgi:hypothetical protein